MERTFSHALLEWLDINKHQFIFGVPGTEFSPLLAALESKKFSVKPITAIHEFAAISMAHGSYLASKAPQVTLLHSTVGIANSMGALINASRMNIPIIVISGKSPSFESIGDIKKDRFIHWGQNSYDYSGLLREYVKYDYEIKDPLELEAVFNRAVAIAMTPPMGPVHISIPSEVLMAKFTKDISNQKRQATPSGPYPDEKQISLIAQKIKDAKFPVIVTNQSGRETGAFTALTNFSKEFNLSIISHKPIYSNFSTSESNFHSLDDEPWLKMADLIISLDTDVPWYPLEKSGQGDKTYIQVGADPLFAAYPTRSFPADYTITSMITPFLQKLSGELKQNLTKEVLLSWKKVSDQLTASSKEKTNFLTELSDVVGQTWDDNTVLFNEYNFSPTGLPLNTPDSYFRAGPASCLGWAIPASLGYKLNNPSKNVITCVGDGTYLFSNPYVCHWIANKYNLSTLTLILNNAGFSSVTTQMNNDLDTEFSGQAPFCDLTPLAPLTAIAESFNNTTHVFEQGRTDISEIKKMIDEFKSKKEPMVVDIKLKC